MKTSLDFKRDIQRRSFKIGDLVVVPTRDLLLHKDQKHHLEPLVMDLLCVLSERPGEVVMREDVIDRIWHVDNGGDENLTRAISVLRKTLRKAGANEDIIETIPKRGYRLRQQVAHVVSSQKSDGQKAGNSFGENKGSLLPAILIALIITMPLLIIVAMKV